MNAGDGKTMIGKAVKIIGDLSGDEDLMMDGELQGTIRLPSAQLTIGPAARVRGDVIAKNIVVFGRLEGDIRSTGRVELRATALVQGNIYAGSLSMEENAAFRGQVDPSRASETMPERSAGATRSSAPASYPPADGPGISMVRGSTQLPAALAAVAANRSSAGAEDEKPSQVTPLFAETEA